MRAPKPRDPKLAVGYVSADDWGDEWYLWRFTDKGIARAKELEATS